MQSPATASNIIDLQYVFALLKHMQIHTEKKRRNRLDAATVAGVSDIKSILIAHLWKNTGEEPYQCSQCNKAISFNNNLMKYL